MTAAADGRVLYERLLASLRTRPDRPVARTLPGNTLLDADSFERRIVGAERRILRLREAGPGAPSEATGDGQGGRVVLLSARNFDSWLVALAVLWKRGLVPLLADADLSRHEIAALARSLGVAAVLLDRPADLPGGVPVDLGESLAGLRAWAPRIATAAPPGGHAAGVGPAVPSGAVLLRLTSGSSGRPRAVAVSAGQLLADAANIGDTLGITPDDTLVTAIPLGHAYGFVHALMALLTRGSRLVLLEQPLPALLIEALGGKGPLVLPGTPYLFEMLLKAAGRKKFRGLRLCVSAGAPLPRALSEAFRGRFGLPIRTFYGASECGGISFDRSRDGVLPDGCVGTPIEGVAVALRHVESGDQEAGRIVVRSRAVALGYLPEGDGGVLTPGRAPAPGDAPDPGTFLTSDLGRIDPHGRILLLGRIDRLINVGGRKVNASEVEAVLRDVPGVRDAWVYGSPDRQRGETVSARVAGARRLTREMILEACRSRLAPFKIPRAVEFVDSIPRTGRGKIGPPRRRRS